MKVTDNRQTDGRQHIANVSSRSLKTNDLFYSSLFKFIHFSLKMSHLDK